MLDSCFFRESAREPALSRYISFNGTLTDSSGNGKTAKDSGTPAYVPGAPFGGKAIDFDGSGKALVTVPINMSVAAMPQVTFGAWVYAKSAANPQYGIISIDDGNFDRTLGIDSRPATSGANWAAFIGGSAVGTIPAATNKWVFFAVSYDQSLRSRNLRILREHRRWHDRSQRKRRLRR